MDDMVMKMFRKISASVACCVSLFAVAGCDVGLGESVDTSAPTLSIEYPPIAAVIKDTFVLYGSCDDDKDVASVSVQVVNTETKEVVDTLNATIDAGGKSWRVDVNPYIEETGKYKYLDGTYQFSVSAVDGAGHSSGESSRTFDLDNTAPVFIISKPGVRKGENKSASKYGSVFTIDGTIADDHTIAVMDVKIFSSTTGELLSAETYDGEQLESFREEEIATAGGTSVTIAQYGSGTRYSQLHPNDSGTETYYAEISLSDNAETYNNPAESDRSAAESKADSIGNTTSKLYLYDDVYTSLMSTKKGLGLSAADLKNILNGTVSNDEALAKLAESETDTSADTDSKLLFSLNPESNPTYTVSGYGFDFSGNGTIQSASSGNTVNFTLNSGLDGVKVDPSTLKVWIKRYESKPNDESSIKEDIASLVGKVGPLDANAKSDGEKTISDEDKQRISDEDGWTCIFDYCDYTGSSVDVESVAITLPTNIKINKYYILAATGYDVDDVAFSHNTVYGFAGNEQGIAPTIEFTSPENAAFVNASDFSFVGTAVVNSESLFVKKLVGTVTAASGSNSNIGSREITLSRMTVAEDMACEDSELGEAFTFDRSTGIWTFTPSKIPNFVSETGAATKYTLSLFAESSSGHNITMSTMVQLDTTKPVVTITTVTPTVSGADFDGSDNVYINGTVRIMGSIVEQNLASVTYDIWASTDLTKELTASDSILAQMKAATENNPNIPAAYDGNLETSNSIDVSFMSSMVTQGMIRGGAIAKDQPIKIRVVITATDKVGNVGIYSSDEYNDGKDFIIYQETDRPKITFGNADSSVTSESGINSETNLFGTTSNNKLSLSFEDDDSVAKYEVYLYNSDGTALAAVNDAYGDANPYSLSPNKTTASLNYLLPETEGVYQVKVVACDSGYVGVEATSFTDAFRRIEVGNFFIAVDSGAPTLSVDSVSAYVSTTDSITGTVSPSTKSFDNGTEISAVFLDSELQELATQPATLSATMDGTSWTFPLSALPANTSKKYILKITATDKYQQKSSTNVTFSMDPNEPTITEPTSKQTVKLDESSYVTLNVVVSDDDGGSGLSTVGYYLSEDNTAPSSYDSVTWTAMNQTNDDWRTTFDTSSVKNEDGILYAFFGAKDNAGNTQVSTSSIELTIDKTAPAITVTGFDGNAVSANGSATTKDSTKTFSVEVADTNLDSLVSDNSSVTVGTGSVSGDVTTYPVTVGWTDSNGSVEDSKTVTFTAKDTNGRETTKKVTLACDNNAPRVTLGTTNEFATSAPQLSGTIKDANITKSASDLKVYLVGSATKEGAVTIDSDGKWTATFSGVDAGTYGIALLAKDTFGNESAYATSGTTVPSFTGTAVALTNSKITIDATAPELSGSVKVGTSANPTTTVESSFYSNGSADIYIAGKVADETGGSGIDTSKVWILPYSKVTSETATDTNKATVDENGNFTFTLSSSSISKSGNVYIRVADKAGNITDTSLFAITFDNTAPKIQSATLSGTKVAGTESYTAYKSGTDESGNDKYFVNTTSGNTFSVSGIATDNLGLAKLELFVNGTSAGSITDENKLSEWKFENVVLASDSTSATLTLTDKAGNTAEKTIALVSDTTAPASQHDEGTTDSYFRIGDAAEDSVSDVGAKYTAGTYGNSTTIKVRGTFTETGSGTSLIYYKLFKNTLPTETELTDFAKDPDGKKTGYFSPLSSAEEKTVGGTKIESTFKTNISGFEEGKNYLALVAVDNVGNKAIDGITFTADEKTLNCYSINVDSKAPTVKGENGTALTNGAGEGDDAYIVFTGTATDANSGIKSVSVSVTIGEEDKAVSDVTVEDATGDDNTENDSNKKKWTAKIPKSLFSSISSGNCPVYATAIDNAGEGNKQTVSVGQISVDKVLPRVKLNSISDAYSSTENDDTEINGTIALSGTVEDENTLRENGENDVSNTVTKIRYAQFDTKPTSAPANNSASWQTLSGLSITGNYSFKVAGFDTTKLADEKYYYIQAVAVDKAGNEGYSEAKLVKVSQDTDRPIVKVTNITKSGSEYFLKYGTNAQISGSISDDDATSSAVVKVFKASSSEIKLGSDGKVDTSSLTGTTTFTESTGEWTFTPANTEDGSKDVYFYAEDNNGKVVYTGCTALLYPSNTTVTARPYFQYKTSDKEESATYLTYKSDSKSPVVAETTESDSGIDVDGKAASSSGNALLSSFVVGGTKKQNISFVITATDASGIAGLALDLYYIDSNGKTHYIANKATNWDVNEEDNKKYIAGVELVEDDSVTYENDNSKWAQTEEGVDTSWTWETGNIDISEVPTGTVTLNITPYDKAGLTGNQSFTFSVDNTGPAISVTSPATNEECTGDITIKGTTTDTGSAGAYTIQWIVPTDTERTTAGSKTDSAEKLAYYKGLKWNGGTGSLYDEATVNVWEFKFDGNYDEASSNANGFVFNAGNPNFTVYDSADFATNDDCTTSDIYNLPVYFMATDNLGNSTVYTSFSIRHNPQWDKPKTEFTYPTTKDYDKNASGTSQGYVTLGGTIRATGSAEIPSGTTTVGAIYVQVADSAAGFTASDKTKASTAVDIKNKTGTKTDGTSYTYSENDGGYGLTVVSAYEALEALKGTAVTVTDDAGAKTYGFSSKAAMDAWWGVKANGTASWNITLNSDDGMNPSGAEDSGTNDIALRACGINADGKFGAWSESVEIHIDDAAPTISSAVNQYSDTLTSSNIVSGTSAVASSSGQSYVSDMFLRGQWYLVLDILDETGISELTVKQTLIEDSSETTSTLAAGSGYFVASVNVDVTDLPKITDSTTTKKGRKVFIPISHEKSQVKYTVVAKDADATGHVANQEFSFKIDNDAPTLASIKNNETLLSVSSENTVIESNSVYAFGGESEDSGSGVERVVFYFMRKHDETTMTTTNDCLLDPMITTSTADSKVAMSGLTPLEITQGSETFYLYAKDISGSVTANTFEGTLDTHIREGGLVYIDGVYRKITSISGSTVNFEPALASSSSSIGSGKTVSFPIAQVIDANNTPELTSANPFTFATGKDDGDGMPESFTKSGTKWTWDASIHSVNIPDGPATLVVLAFDEAGNVAKKSYSVMVANNAPKLAKVFLGTDLNNNSKYENEEFETYNILGAAGNEQETYTLNFASFAEDYSDYVSNSTGKFTVKNKLAVIPEIVGGNGSIQMVAKKGATTETAVTSANGTAKASITDKTSTATSATALTDTTTVTADTFAASKVGNKFFAYELTNMELVGKTTGPVESDDGTDKSFSFTFWDSTEERTQGTNSQNAVLLVEDFEFDLVDGTAPKVVVNPFYWKKLNSNSIYGSDVTDEDDNYTVSSIGDLKGHIELENDIKDNTSITSVLGTDPKVSGKITFTGTAYDEHSLKSLAFTFSNGTVTPFNNVLMATYNQNTSKWTPATATMSDDGYEVSITEAAGDSYGVFNDSVYFGQKGHKIYWKLSIDTEKLSTTVATDMSLTVLATDLSGNVTSTDSTKISAPTKSPNYIPGQELSDSVTYTVTDGTTNYPIYQMDVVPYVTKVYTTLAKNKTSNWSVYNRTALGHYPVQSVVSNISGITLKTTTSEDVTLYGFNLNSSTATITSGSNSFVTTATGNLKLTVGTDSTYGQKVSFNVAKLSSGILNLKVGGISVLNNINNNNSKGAASGTGTAYANCYNRQPNGDTNNILADDIVFDVWEFNDRAAEPINGLAAGINMEINQTTGMLNYAFANGGLYFSMGGNTNKTTAYDATNSYSSIYWAGDYDTFASPCVGFHVDELGYTYAVDSGGDTNTSGSVDKWVFYSSRWTQGRRDTEGTLSGSNSLRLEEIGLKTGTSGLDYSLMKYRFLSSEFASTVNKTNSTTNLYMVYYDALCNQIRFRAGTFSGTDRQPTGGFQDEYTNGASSYYKTNNCQIIANGSAGATFKTSATESKTVAGISGRGAGQYVDVAVVKNGTRDVVCVVWYDVEANNMKFSYITDPISKWNSLKGNETAASWSTPQTIFSEGGEYCHIVADKNNHLHVAAYAGNGDVMYAYLDTYSSDAQTCTVDASGSVGEHLTLDVAVNSANHSIPYIGYYTGAIKKPKYAYLVDPTIEDSTATFTQVADGADSSELFTGDWEVAVVPTPSTMTTNREDKVNVGVWKSSGVLKDSKVGGEIKNSSSGGTFNGYSSTNWSKTFGNGTANGVLGYQISTATGSCLETAQMR
ncbi:hypothetical protein [Treponema saccharophilum]|uniref:Uncharacterized protein n=1 Tax=Treponema saccharophilum DSM 2985 TaxID=907348 RepID=H7EKS7_9SPIR|nr:hypothetical protein [Treponema saccharophilum]EIC01835.1 hypothetical protein TresaDRAFT_1977 [Treponema saccharophilum DSM 2985]BDC96779.1 hypothetical protein TRSA_18780 [Treponema saccharophilum]